MAFIAPLAGAALGGGLLGNLATAAVGLGINLAIAYFFPQKIKGPRAESLKAQTSRYGDHVARVYGTLRAAGAVIWLKDDKVDEHVRTYRQGKALGPEVTEYSYTATFAVAFCWNGPVAAIPRIWADDKLIYDASAEALQDAIDNGGSAIGVAEGASVTVYLGTDTQQPDPDIEADRGAGNVPAWPKVAYVVIKNLPLEEFGIRVPNIEAEIIQAGTESTASVSPDLSTHLNVQIDTNGNYVAGAHTDSTLFIGSMPAATAIFDGSTSYAGFGLHITDRNEVAVLDWNTHTLHVYDAATGALQQSVTGVLPNTTTTAALMDDITVAGVTHLFAWRSGSRFTHLTNDGSGYEVDYSVTTTAYGTNLGSLSAGPDYVYAVHANGTDIIRVEWDAISPVISVVSPAVSGAIGACHYDEESDSVIILTQTGNIYVYTADLSTLLRSSTGNGFAISINSLQSKRMKSGSDRIAVINTGLLNNDVFEFRVSDLSLIRTIDASSTTWDGEGNTAYIGGGANPDWDVVLVTGSSGAAPARLWYLPRASRGTVALVDVIEAECQHAGLTPDVSDISGQINGYGARGGEAPRGVIEDLCRVNFLDWAQVDGVITFFPRETSAVRTITVAETGMALNAEPDPVQVREEYPDGKDIPEQVVITYPSYDAEYRTGAQSGTPEEGKKFDDEPSEADETGFPVKVRRKRAMEFSTAQVLTDQAAARVADLMHNELRDAATVYKTTLGPQHLDLHPGQVVNLPLDDSRTAKAVLTRMSGETVLEAEFRKRGDSYVSEAVAQPTPYVVDTLLGIASVAPALIDGHLLRAADDNDGFYAGVAVTSAGNFRSASLYQSEDGGTTYAPWAGFVNGMIRGIATAALPDRPHPDAFDRTTSFTIAVPVGTAPDSVSEAVLLASEASNGFAVWNASVGDWEYILAASVVDNGNHTWTLSTLLRGRKGTEFAMAGHASGATVYHLDADAMGRMTDGDRTLSRIYVAVAASTVFDSTGAVAFTNQGKGLRPWAPHGLAVARDGSGNITGTFNRRDRLGQQWPESGAETPPMSETAESYRVKVYSGVGVLLRTITTAIESFSYSAADQTTDFGSAQSSIDFGRLQVSATYGDGIEVRETL